METRRSRRLLSKETVQENGSDSPAPKKRKVDSKPANSSAKKKEKPAKPIKSAYFGDENGCECSPPAPKRRARQSKSSYFESPVESENESDYQSDSDEAAPSKSQKKAVKKPTYESESDSSSEESTRPSNSARSKAAAKKQTSIFKLESDSSADESEKPKPFAPKPIPISNRKKSSFESESESSSDEFVKAPESLLDLPKTEVVDSTNADASDDDLENDTADSKPTEYFDFTSLVSQVTEAAKATGNHDKPEEKKPEEKKQKETPEKKPKRGAKKPPKATPSTSQLKTEQLEVCELLAMGENTDLTAKDIKETVENSTQGYEIPNQVEVLLDAPALKKKKRCNDLEIALRRRLNNIKREHQVYIHKVHVLCYIAHGNYLNSVLNSADVLGVALSLLPSDKCYPPKRMNMEYLEDLLNWFGKKIKCKQILVSNELKDLRNSLQNQLEIREALCKTHFCFMFLCLLRALGIQCRLVVNLNVLPIKPSSDQLLPVNQKSEEEIASSSKKKTPAKPASKSKVDEKAKKAETSSQEKKKTPPSSKSSSSSKSGSKKKESSSLKEEKPIRKSGRQNQGSSKYFEGDDDEDEPKSKSSKSKSKSKKKVVEPLVEEMSSTDESDFEDFVSPKKKKIDRRVLSSEDDKDAKSTKDTKADKPKPDNKINYWIEVYLEAEEKWFCVDVVKKSYHCIKQLYNNASHPVRYVLAWNNDQSIKDVTRRYVPQYLTVTKKLRVDDSWWNSTMKPYKPPRTPREKEEDEELDKILEELPIPASISECKSHPLYAMKRHLLKFQGIYPPDSIPVGYIKGEPVYSRLCVQQLHGREMWIKEAKVVRLNETPYKIVKGRPQKSKFGKSTEPPKDLELFGSWQVEDYIPPTAENGKVPRNAFGNVELFKPSMLPKGTVYLQIPGLQRIANKLGIDCAAAITGFEYSTNGWSYPVKDGFVVCEEFKDVLLDAYNQEVEEQEKKEKLKREERVYANWRRLIKGLFIREKLKRKYNFGDPEASTSKADVKNKSK